MQIEDIISSINELQARLARLAKKIDEIYAAICLSKEGGNG